MKQKAELMRPVEQTQKQQRSKTGPPEKLAFEAQMEKSLDVGVNTCYTDKKAEDKMWQCAAAVSLTLIIL